MQLLLNRCARLPWSSHMSSVNLGRESETADDEQLSPLRKQLLSTIRAGRQDAAASLMRKHTLSGQALEMLADMRTQSASMPTDIGFVRP